MKTWFIIFTYVFFTVLSILIFTSAILDVVDNRNKTCEEFKNVSIWRTPVRCLNFFSK